MSLIARLTGAEKPVLYVHEFARGLALYLTGKITKAQFVAYMQAKTRPAGTALNFTQAEDTQLANIQTKFNNLSANEKLSFILSFEGAMDMLISGVLTVAEFKSILGIAED